MPVGPHFDYGRAPYLFLGRRGDGPLHVAWDTNLLIDYFQHGRALWDRENEFESPYNAELEALQVLIALWVIRDIRLWGPAVGVGGPPRARPRGADQATAAAGVPDTHSSAGAGDVPSPVHPGPTRAGSMIPRL